LEEMVNCECLLLSHNYIKDLEGISQITTLLELNLSFNRIHNICSLSDLTLLEKLWLNRNQIMMIEPLKDLKSLKVLGLFHNEIFHEEKTLETLMSLPKLQELAIDGNPVSVKPEFHYGLILTLGQLQILDEEAIKDLDKDIAS
jgi:Leucine-rich repeat (LRR) protein